MILYIIWSLLPLTLLFIGLWGVSKSFFGQGLNVSGKKHSVFYVRQAVFCSFVLAIAIFVEESEVLSPLDEATESTAFDLSLAHWLIYPALLVLFSSLRQFFVKKK